MVARFLDWLSIKPNRHWWALYAWLILCAVWMPTT